jgi:hypothetical protein
MLQFPLEIISPTTALQDLIILSSKQYSFASKSVVKQQNKAIITNVNVWKCANYEDPLSGFYCIIPLQ